MFRFKQTHDSSTAPATVHMYCTTAQHSESSLAHKFQCQTWPEGMEPANAARLPEKHLFRGVSRQGKLRALVYEILPSTTAVFSYAIGSRKLSANEQLFCWCSNCSKFVKNNSKKTRRIIYSRQQSLHQHR